MNFKKIYIVVFLVLMVTTALLMTAVVSLVDQKGENQETIDRLSQKTANLQEKVAHYEKEKEKFEFYRFKQNVFNLKYPDYSQIAKIVFKKSKRYGFNPYLVMAVIQAAVIPEMQGRVFTLIASVAAAMSPLGLIAAGPVADVLGVRTWFIVGGVVTALMGVISFFIPAVTYI